MGRRLVASLLGLALGCAPATGIEAPLTPAQQRLYEGEAAAVAPLSEGNVLVDGTDGLWIIGSRGPSARVGEPGELGDFHASATNDGATLVAAEHSVVLVRGAAMVGAALGAVLDDGERVHALTATPRNGQGADLWVATSAGLRLFRDGALSRIEITGFDLADAELAAAGASSVWVGTAAGLLRITVDETSTVRATSHAEPTGITSLASDTRGVPWMIAGGALHALEAGPELIRFELEEELRTVHASSGANDVWVRGTSRLFHAQGRVVRPVEGISADVTPFVTPDGDAVALDREGVVRLRARHRFQIEGLLEGARLVDTVDASLLLEAPGTPEIIAQIDRRPVEVAGTTITIDPATLGVGSHRLDVTVRWSDGTLPATATRRFSVAPAVTWTEHIRPLYAEHCSACHGPAGPSPTRLDSRAAWERDFPRILDNLVTGRMPLGLPRLTDDTIALIETWADSGFPE